MSESEEKKDPYSKEAFKQVELPPLVQQFLDKRVKARYAENTYKSRRNSYRSFKLFCDLNGHDMLQPTVQTVDDYMDEMLIEGYQPRTVKNRVYDLSALWQYCAPRNDETVNVVDDDNFEMLDTSSEMKVEYIEIGDYEELLDAAEKTRNKLLIQMLWQTGVRSTELVNIKLSDIQREDRSITITNAKQRSLSDGDEERTVWFKPSLGHTIADYVDGGARNSYPHARESEYLFLTKQSERMNHRRPTEIVRECAERADIQDVKFRNRAGEKQRSVSAHTLRHSFAVHRTKNGMPIPILKKLMGHNQITTTEVYLKFKDDDVEDVEKRFRP